MKTLITKSGLEQMHIKLKEKLELLKSLRNEKAHAYTVSGDGWHDNPGWIQIGQQEDILVKEVSELQNRIAHARIIDASLINTDQVQIGCKVSFLVTKKGSSQSQSISIVGNGESDLKNSKISTESPIGKALCNMRIGEEKEILLPGGLVKIRIQSINNG